MRKLISTLVVVMALVLSATAQNRTISGRVTDESGNPVPNVSVILKGTSIGTNTDLGGNYSLSIPATAKVLVFSSVGKEPQEIEVRNRNSVSPTLKISNTSLSEVVVTAYGTTKKKNFTGTASVINSEKFKDLQVTTIGGILQGNASGVLAVSSNGQPGENPTIRIRGIGSVNGSSDPLIILDGAQYGGNINNLNPNDIESITVLKDASSTALYGNRAANGVLIITTKSGKGIPKVSFSALTGYSTRAVPDYQYVNSQQLYELTWEGIRNEGLLSPNLVSAAGATSAADYASKTVVGRLVYNPFGVAQPIGLDGKLVSNAKNLWNQNWADALLQTGVRKDINLSISGGNDKTKYFLSGGYLDDQGIAIESKFKRYSGRLKVDTKVNNWLTAGVNMNLAYSTQNYPVQGGSGYSNVIGWIRAVSSIYPEYVLDTATGNPILNATGQKQYDYGNNGQLKRTVLTPGNPAGTTSQNPTSYDRFITSVNSYAEAQIVNGLKFRTQYSIDFYQFGQNTYFNPFIGDGAAYGGRSFKSREQTVSQTFTNTLTYDRLFGSVHHINLLAGAEAYRFHDETVAAEARGFTFPNVTELAYGSVPYSANSYAYDNRLASYFGRINYDLGEKYHISGSLRRDGTSRFSDSVKYGTFYSVGAAWNINKENFLRNVKAISDLKLRASYGTTGNQLLISGFGNLYFPYLGTYATGANIAGYSGSIISSLANGNLTWETQKTQDLGIDFGFLKNRITGSYTYFTRTSDKLLFSNPLAPSVGIQGINSNIGSVKNEGYEIDLTTINIQKRDFQWSTTVNISHVKNKITSLPAPSITGSNFSNLIVGESLYNFYIREYAGVDLSDGRPVWYMDQTDVNGKVTKITTKTYSAATRYYKGTALPKLTGGFSSTVRYKNFDFSFLASFSIGGKIYDDDYGGLNYAVTGTNAGYNWSVDILNRWQSAQNPGDGRTPKLTSVTDYQANSASTRFLFDASYARIRNITLGFRLPKEVLDRVKISNARFYIDWQNPFTIFARKGLDPESGIAGVTSNTSSAYKTLSVGVNFDF
jgi:TonB-linked SusC/RagA family outer membrane protein